MEGIRKPFQGVMNIIHFNWHFYVGAILSICLLLLLGHYLNGFFQMITYMVICWIAITVLISLLVSFYIYDLSGLYHFKWIEDWKGPETIVNINAGFDETSTILHDMLENSELIVLDFYDPMVHTEVSIKRARKAYGAFPGTIQIKSTYLPLTDESADRVFVILSAHEIRNEAERILFFEGLKRILKPEGKVYVVEHLRDTANFLAYTIGFFHFYARKSWLKTFQKAGLKVEKEIKQTPFISIFILSKNGNAI